MILKQQSILVVFEEKHYQRLSIEGLIYPLQSYILQFEFSCDRQSLTIVCQYIHLFGLPLDYEMVASGYSNNPW